MVLRVHIFGASLYLLIIVVLKVFINFNESLEYFTKFLLIGSLIIYIKILYYIYIHIYIIGKNKRIDSFS